MRKILNILSILIIFSLIFINFSFANAGTLKDTDFLNVRESPSTSSNIVTVLPKDASFEITGEEGDWYKIKYQDYTGYVSKQYVSINENVVNTNIPPRANSNGIINKNSKLYILPLLNSTVIENINPNTEILVVSITGKWAYIQTDTNSGWIFTDNINGTDETNIATTNNSETNDNINNSNSDINNSVSNNNELDNNSVVNNNDANNSNSTNDENNTSNENNNSNNTQNENNSNYPKTMYVNVDAVYIRSQATTSSNIVASVGLNTPVTVNGEEGEWYKVNVTDGSGYMMKKYLSENKQ